MIALPPVRQRERAMPITYLLRNRAFDPETIRVMSDAFTEACDTLGLADRTDQITAFVAERNIELASRGVRSKNALYTSTIREFTPDPQ
jgi:hypothetical protein